VDSEKPEECLGLVYEARDVVVACVSSLVGLCHRCEMRLQIFLNAVPVVFIKLFNTCKLSTLKAIDWRIFP